jgi:hypothetical protein
VLFVYRVPYNPNSSWFLGIFLALYNDCTLDLRW